MGLQKNIKHLIKCISNSTRRKTKFHKILIWLCDHSGGHVQSNDIGYSGGPMIDVWCKYCDAMYQVPKSEKDILEFFKVHMENFDQGMRGLPID